MKCNFRKNIKKKKGRKENIGPYENIKFSIVECKINIDCNNFQQIIEYWLHKRVGGFRINAIRHLFEITDITLDEPRNNVVNVSKNECAYLRYIYTKDQDGYISMKKHPGSLRKDV